MALVGAWRQRGFGNLHVGDAIWIGVLSPLGAVAGVVIANAVSQRTLELSFAALVLVIAVSSPIGHSPAATRKGPSRTPARP